MEKDKSRAQRRWQQHCRKRHIGRKWLIDHYVVANGARVSVCRTLAGWGELEVGRIGRGLQTATTCSCWMCGNPRRYTGERTVAERSFQELARHEGWL